MNLGELISEFRILAQDTAKPYLWPDSELAVWFSEAETEAAIRAKLIRENDSFEIKAGDNSAIELSSLIFEIEYAELIDSAGTSYEVFASSRSAMDKDRRGWRQRTERPTHYIHDDKSMILTAIPDQDYTLYVEYCRTPAIQLEADSDEPEISDIHHVRLLDWAMFRAYSKPDADTMNKEKSDGGESRFIANFGKRPNADLRRRQNANRPHRNRLQW